MISINVKKLDDLPGFLTLYLEYFDTVKCMKDGIYMDRNTRVPPSQQQLFFEEKPLNDDSLTLSECGMENGSQVEVRGTCVIVDVRARNSYSTKRFWCMRGTLMKFIKCEKTIDQLCLGLKQRWPQIRGKFTTRKCCAFTS